MSKKVGVLKSIRISGNVEMPLAGSPRQSKYPYHKLRIGESFPYPAGTKLCTAQSSAYSQTDGKKKFVARRQNGEIRCWRVE